MRAEPCKPLSPLFLYHSEPLLLCGLNFLPLTFHLPLQSISNSALLLASLDFNEKFPLEPSRYTFNNPHKLATLVRANLGGTYVRKTPLWLF